MRARTSFRRQISYADGFDLDEIPVMKLGHRHYGAGGLRVSEHLGIDLLKAGQFSTPTM
jgi:hypothetical protein